MAVYAFDGTTNQYHGPLSPDNTNVVRFLECCDSANTGPAAIGVLSEDEEYVAGVGTRLGHIGKVIGGFSGMGGRERVRELKARLEENWKAGDQVVDVIGYSRGAALALHFCNALADGIEIGGETVTPKVRFLGLWDTVPSFGLPGVLIDAFNALNIGWKLRVPANVRYCGHVMALDEDRQAFQVYRPLVKDPRSAKVEEIWMRGTHADIGGAQPGLSSIALLWMLERAEACGVAVLSAAMEEVRERCNPDEPISSTRFTGDKEHRKPRVGDLFHPTAALPLAVGEGKRLLVDAKKKFDVSKVLIEPDSEYVFELDPEAEWVDKDIRCTCAGWPDNLGDQKPGILDDIKWAVLRSYVFSNFRRVPTANWFELVACLDYDLDTATPIGQGHHSTSEKPWRPEGLGRLTLFANDSELKYDNNEGEMPVTIRRVA
ncbi:MAG: DUF2235 domain-containing protein [Thiohalocapsa sp.]|jgi:hypothetical protein